MIEHRIRAGKLIYFMSRLELEALKGYRGNDHRGRACCPIHRGDNPTALSIDWSTGWASCWSCDDAWSIRITDHPDTKLPRDHVDGNAFRKPVKGSPRVALPKPDRHVLKQSPAVIPDDLRARLQRAIDGAGGQLPGSPGDVYLRGRGIPIAVARSLRLGWSTSDPLRNRVVFPITDSDGRPTSATGRAVDDYTQPRYKALKASDGYVRTYFHGAAIGQARSSGRPLIMVEGPMDAVACVAGGIDLVVATMGVSVTRPEDFQGVRSILIAYDSDDTGQKRRRRLMGDLLAEGIDVVALAAGTLGDCKDIAEYWQRHGALPAPLLAWVSGSP
jgi:hypothetical protein